MTASPATVTEKPTPEATSCGQRRRGTRAYAAAMAGRERDERDGKKPI